MIQYGQIVGGRQDRFDENLDRAATGEAQVAGEVGIEVLSQQAWHAILLRGQRGRDHFGLDAAAAHRAHEPPFRPHQHLLARGHRRRTARLGHRGERRLLPFPGQLARGAPNLRRLAHPPKLLTG